MTTRTRRRIALGLGITAMAVAGPAALTRADDVAPPAGLVADSDPLAGYDWAPPVDDGEVAALAADGATVTEAPCSFGDRPGVVGVPIFRRPLRTTGHFVVSPSGNATLVCHAVAQPAMLQRPLPTSAITVDGAPCFLPNRRRTSDSHLVVTPSLHVHLICHLSPAP